MEGIRKRRSSNARYKNKKKKVSILKKVKRRFDRIISKDKATVNALVWSLIITILVAGILIYSIQTANQPPPTGN